METQQWSVESAPTLTYTIRTTESLQRVDSAQPHRCTLATATFAARRPLKFPCFPCSRFIRLAEYLQHYEALFTHALRRAYSPHVPRSHAAIMAGDFTRSVLRPIVAAHRCPMGTFASIYEVKISVQRGPAPSPDAAVVNRVMLESFEEALSRPVTKPAAVMPIIDLVMARADEEIEKRDRFESGWNGADHECVICMEEIEKPWKSLRLPCSHVFHESCLDPWFDNNHVCPLCRYEMPSAD